MSAHRVFLVGDSLFSESLSQLLGRYDQVCITGSSTTIEDALQDAFQKLPDVFVIAAPERWNPQDLSALFEAFPTVPVICAELATNRLRVFTSQQLQASPADLISAITSLPQRR